MLKILLFCVFNKKYQFLFFISEKKCIFVAIFCIKILNNNFRQNLQNLQIKNYGHF
jgi:hypothetical protein